MARIKSTMTPAQARARRAREAKQRNRLIRRSSTPAPATNATDERAERALRRRVARAALEGRDLTPEEEEEEDEEDEEDDSQEVSDSPSDNPAPPPPSPRTQTVLNRQNRREQMLSAKTSKSKHERSIRSRSVQSTASIPRNSPQGDRDNSQDQVLPSVEVPTDPLTNLFNALEAGVTLRIPPGTQQPYPVPQYTRFVPPASSTNPESSRRDYVPLDDSGSLPQGEAGHSSRTRYSFRRVAGDNSDSPSVEIRSLIATPGTPQYDPQSPVYYPPQSPAPSSRNNVSPRLARRSATPRGVLSGRVQDASPRNATVRTPSRRVPRSASYDGPAGQVLGDSSLFRQAIPASEAETDILPNTIEDPSPSLPSAPNVRRSSVQPRSPAKVVRFSPYTPVRSFVPNSAGRPQQLQFRAPQGILRDPSVSPSDRFIIRREQRQTSSRASQAHATPPQAQAAPRWPVASAENQADDGTLPSRSPRIAMRQNQLHRRMQMERAVSAPATLNVADRASSALAPVAPGLAVPAPTTERVAAPVRNTAAFDENWTSGSDDSEVDSSPSLCMTQPNAGFAANGSEYTDLYPYDFVEGSSVNDIADGAAGSFLELDDDSGSADGHSGDVLTESDMSDSIPLSNTPSDVHLNGTQQPSSTPPAATAFNSTPPPPPSSDQGSEYVPEYREPDPSTPGNFDRIVPGPFNQAMAQNPQMRALTNADAFIENPNYTTGFVKSFERGREEYVHRWYRTNTHGYRTYNGINNTHYDFIGTAVFDTRKDGYVELRCPICHGNGRWVYDHTPHAPAKDVPWDFQYFSGIPELGDHILDFHRVRLNLPANLTVYAWFMRYCTIPGSAYGTRDGLQLLALSKPEPYSDICHRRNLERIYLYRF